MPYHYGHCQQPKKIKFNATELCALITADNKQYLEMEYLVKQSTSVRQIHGKWQVNTSNPAEE